MWKFLSKKKLDKISKSKINIFKLKYKIVKTK